MKNVVEMNDCVWRFPVNSPNPGVPKYHLPPVGEMYMINDELVVFVNSIKKMEALNDHIVYCRDPKDPTGLYKFMNQTLQKLVEKNVFKKLGVVPDDSTPRASKEMTEGQTASEVRVSKEVIRRLGGSKSAEAEMLVNFYDRRVAYVKAVLESGTEESDPAAMNDIISKTHRKCRDHRPVPSIQMIRNWIEAYRNNGNNLSILKSYKLSLN